jgi:hypothetical protein
LFNQTNHRITVIFENGYKILVGQKRKKEIKNSLLKEEKYLKIKLDNSEKIHVVYLPEDMPNSITIWEMEGEEIVVLFINPYNSLWAKGIPFDAVGKCDSGAGVGSIPEVPSFEGTTESKEGIHPESEEDSYSDEYESKDKSELKSSNLFTLKNFAIAGTIGAVLFGLWKTYQKFQQKEQNNK